MSNGKRTGLWKLYDIEGNLFGTSNFINAQLEGKSIGYFKNGKTKAILYFKNNKENGISQSFLENGKLEANFTFKEGRKHGPRKTFYENGRLKFLGALYIKYKYRK